jgi:hypothetical protein
MPKELAHNRSLTFLLFEVRLCVGVTREVYNKLNTLLCKPRRDAKGAIVAGTQTPVAEAAAYVYYAFPDGVSVSFSENTMILTVEGKSIYINTVTQKKQKCIICQVALHLM